MPEEIFPTIETPQPTEPKSFDWPKIILAVLLGLGLLAGAAYVGYWYGTQQALLAPTSLFTEQSASTTTANFSPTSEYNYESPDYWKGKLLLVKEYGDFKLGAFDVGEFLGAVFIVAPIDNGIPVTYANAFALSFASNAFMRENLFDVVGEKIYVLNQKRNFIDVYTARFYEKTLATAAFYLFEYVGSIDSPRYEVGVPYSIKCQEKQCRLRTAHHQESGCDMELNLETEQYSGLKCSAMGVGEFLPEPL